LGIQYIQFITAFFLELTYQHRGKEDERRNTCGNDKGLGKAPIVRFAQIISAVLLVSSIENDIEDVGTLNFIYIHFERLC
jgi:hypothetical protein